MASNLAESLASLQTSLNNLISYCNGTVPLPENKSTLFYQHDGGASFINFMNPSESDLEGLAKACQPATFGLQNVDVFDESYRKAGKLDSDKFAISFNPFDNGILDVVRDLLVFSKQAAVQPIRAELYKLNVYGPGSFFKAHVDTPRSGNMFGSLVLIFPTKHEGGSLIFKHLGQEWSFDSANAVDPTDGLPKVAYVAFYSDVQHEVTEVKFGYRVTLTYNLFIENVEDDPQRSISVGSHSVIDDQLASAFRAALEDLTLLPEGGICAFGLSYKYPLNMQTHGRNKMTRIAEQLTLKGVDGAIQQLCQSLGLNPAIMGYTQGKEYTNESVFGCVTPYMPTITREVSDPLLCLKEECQGTLVYNPEELTRDALNQRFEYRRYNSAVPIHWVKPFDTDLRIPTPYLAYGNDASLDYLYVPLCLVMTLGPVGDRQK